MKKALAVQCLAITVGIPALAQYPDIATLTLKDLLFKQLQESIELAHRREARGDEPPDLAVFQHRLAVDSDFFPLCARLGLPYDSMATLNRLRQAGVLPVGTVIVIPSVPGVFVPEKPESDLELLMHEGRIAGAAPYRDMVVTLPSGTVKYRFYPGARLNQAERGFFLNAMFRYPLPKGRLTSGFGYRPDPFSGETQSHKGIDLAAPRGTEVFAVREGTVVAADFSPVYGNYVLVRHGGGWESMYGHLDSTGVRLNQTVKSGMILGTVGSTGQSTGPHLHFELRDGGVPKNPEPLLPRSNR